MKLTRRQLLLWGAGMALAMCWDRAVYVHLSAHSSAEKAGIEQWWAFDVFYQLGRVPAWAGIAAAVVLAGFFGKHARDAQRAIRRGLYVLASAALAGAAAEVLKLLLRRVRPMVSDRRRHSRTASRSLARC